MSSTVYICFDKAFQEWKEANNLNIKKDFQHLGKGKNLTRVLDGETIAQLYKEREAAEDNSKEQTRKRVHTANANGKRSTKRSTVRNIQPSVPTPTVQVPKPSLNQLNLHQPRPNLTNCLKAKIAIYGLPGSTSSLSSSRTTFTTP